MTQITNIESFGSEDPAVTAWREAFIETARVIPDAIETVTKRIGDFLLKND